MVIRAGLNPFSSSPRRCWMDLRSVLCAGYSQGFPQLSGITIALWGWHCAQGHCHVEKETFSLNCCHKRGSSVFFIRRCDSWELRCYLPLLSVLHHHLSHTEIQSLISPQNWHNTVLLAPSSEVSSHTRLCWWAAMPNKLDWEDSDGDNKPFGCTPSQTSNVNKVCWSSQEDANSMTVGKCLQIDSS